MATAIEAEHDGIDLRWVVRWTLLGLPIGLLVLVALIHWPVLKAQAQCWADSQYLTQNDLVQKPGWATPKRFLTEVLEQEPDFEQHIGTGRPRATREPCETRLAGSGRSIGVAVRLQLLSRRPGDLGRAHQSGRKRQRLIDQL